MIYNKTFRIFISSTFKDFEDERIIINTKIKEKIKEDEELVKLFEKYACDFEFVDLQWGISEEAVNNNLVVPICLSEVDKCKKSNIRPYLVGLLGKNDGTTFPPETIEQGIWNQIFNTLQSKDKEFLESVYYFEKNYLIPKYVLKRAIELQDRDRIVKILREAKECLSKYGTEVDLPLKPITEQELEKGLFDSDCDPDGSIMMICCPKEKNIPLINRTIDRFKGSKSKITYIDQVKKDSDDSESYEAYKTKFETILFKKLKKRIKEEIGRLSNEEPDENQELKTYIEAYNKVFLCRDKELESLKDYIHDLSEKKIQWIIGDAGSGKTALLMKLYVEMSDFSQIYPYFHGIGKATTSFIQVLDDILLKVTGKEYTLQYETGMEEFWRILKNSDFPKDKKTVIVIDAINEYNDYRFFQERFRIDVLPENLKIIISTNQDKDVDGEKKILRIDSFHSSHGLKIFDEYMNNRGRCLSSIQRRQLEHLLKEQVVLTPTRIRMLAFICAKKKREDEIDVDNIDEATLLRRVIHILIADQGFTEELVYFVLAVLAVAPNGATIPELMHWCYSCKSVRQNCITEKNPLPEGENELPRIFISRLLYELEDNIFFSYSHDDEIVILSHNIYRDVLCKLPEFEKYIAFAKKILLHYFYELPSFKGKEYGSTRKAYSLLPLAESCGDKNILIRSITDESFVDLLIRTSQFSYLLRLCREYKDNADVKKMYHTLLKYYDALIVYPDYFGKFINNDREYRAKRFVAQESNEVDYEAIPFPYSGECRIHQHNENPYLLIEDYGKLILYDKKHFSEILRDGNPKIKSQDYQLFWINEYTFCVIDNTFVKILKIQNEGIELIKTEEDRNILPPYRKVWGYYDKSTKSIHLLLIRKNPLSRKCVTYTVDCESGIVKKDDDGILSDQRWKALTEKKKAYVDSVKKRNDNSWLILYSPMVWKNGEVLTSCGIMDYGHLRYICPESIENLQKVSYKEGSCYVVFLYSSFILFLNLDTMKYERRVDIHAIEVIWNDENSVFIRTKHGLIYKEIEKLKLMDKECILEESESIALGRKEIINPQAFRSEWNSQEALSQGIVGSVTMMAFTDHDMYAEAHEFEDVIYIKENDRIIHTLKGYHFTPERYLKRMYFSREEDYFILELNNGNIVFDLIENRKVRSKKEKGQIIATETLLRSKGELPNKWDEESIIESAIKRIGFSEHSLETQIREKNQMCSRYSFGKKWEITVLPQLKSVFLYKRGTNILVSVYYVPEGITGCRIINENMILLGDTNGKIFHLGIDNYKNTFLEKTCSRRKRSVAERFVQGVKKNWFLFPAGMVSTGVILYLLRPTVFSWENLVELDNWVVPIKVEIAQGMKIRNYFSYKYTEELKGVIYSEKKDFDNDGTEEKLVFVADMNQEDMQIMVYMLDDKNIVLDKYYIGSYKPEIHGKVDILFSEKENGKILFGIDSVYNESKRSKYGEVSYGAGTNNMQHVALLEFHNGKIREYILTDTDTYIEREEGDVYISGDLMLADQSDYYNVKSSIYFRNDLSREYYNYLPESGERELASVTFRRGSRTELNRHDAPAVEKKTFFYSSAIMGVSWQMPEKLIAAGDINEYSGEIKQLDQEEKRVESDSYNDSKIGFSLRQTMNNNVMYYFTELLFRENHNIRTMFYSDDLFTLEYTERGKAHRITGWYNERNLTYILHIEYDPVHIDEARLLEDSIRDTMISEYEEESFATRVRYYQGSQVGLDYMYDGDDAIQSVREYYQTIANSRMLRETLRLSDQLLYSIHSVGTQLELWMEDLENKKLVILYLDRQDHQLKYHLQYTYKSEEYGGNLRISSDGKYLIDGEQKDGRESYVLIPVGIDDDSAPFCLDYFKENEANSALFVITDVQGRKITVDANEYDEMVQTITSAKEIVSKSCGDNVIIPWISRRHEQYQGTDITVCVQGYVYDKLNNESYSSISYEISLENNTAVEIQVHDNQLELEEWRKIFENEARKTRGKNRPNTHLYYGEEKDAFLSVYVDKNASITYIGNRSMYELRYVKKIGKYSVVLKSRLYDVAKNNKLYDVIECFKEICSTITFELDSRIYQCNFPSVEEVDNF